MADTWTDNALIKRFQRGDTAAFEQFVTRHQDRIFRLATAQLYVTRDAADATQEVFLRAFTGLPGFRFGAEPFTWLYRATKNVCLEFNRRASRTTPLEAADMLTTDAGVAGQLDAMNVGARVRAVVARLPERQRDVVLLRIFEDLSVAETARALRCREGTVKALLSKAMNSLRGLTAVQALQAERNAK